MTDPADILGRLRAPMWKFEPSDIQRVAVEAADEIERLRAHVADLEAEVADLRQGPVFTSEY
jgi:cell division protein FtsB